MQLEFIMRFILCLLPGFIPVALTDFFPVQISAVKAPEVLKPDNGRIDRQKTMVS